MAKTAIVQKTVERLIILSDDRSSDGRCLIKPAAPDKRAWRDADIPHSDRNADDQYRPAHDDHKQAEPFRAYATVGSAGCAAGY
jgi:hypothetical protein